MSLRRRFRSKRSVRTIRFGVPVQKKPIANKRGYAGHQSGRAPRNVPTPADGAGNDPGTWTWLINLGPRRSRCRPRFSWECPLRNYRLGGRHYDPNSGPFLDHYKFYNATGSAINTAVDLVDQSSDRS